jgi:hypothetical protein
MSGRYKAVSVAVRSNVGTVYLKDMDSLNDVLSNRNFDEPPEVASVKKYIQDMFHVTVTVQVREHELIVIVSSAALANTLRLRAPDLKHRCQLEKRLVIRID